MMKAKFCYLFRFMSKFTEHSFLVMFSLISINFVLFITYPSAFGFISVEGELDYHYFILVHRASVNISQEEETNT